LDEQMVGANAWGPRTRRDQELAVVALFQALGGGWEDDAGDKRSLRKKQNEFYEKTFLG
jgi:hypothetical protein